MLTAPRKRFAFSAYIRLLAVQEEAIFVVNPSGNCGRAGGVWGLSKEGRNENFFSRVCSHPPPSAVNKLILSRLHRRITDSHPRASVR